MKRDKRTREQRKADASAWAAFGCFLGILLLLLLRILGVIA